MDSTPLLMFKVKVYSCLVTDVIHGCGHGTKLTNTRCARSIRQPYRQKLGQPVYTLLFRVVEVG